LYFFGKIPRQEVDADKLAGTVGNIGPKKSRPRQKKHGRINVPGHGKMEETQYSRKKDQRDKRGKTDAAQ
jgi:hypothetical protein